MEIAEAMKILGFSSLDQINSTALKKQYKRAALKAHPDVGGSNELMQSVYEAKGVLDRYYTAYKVMETLKTQSQVSRCVIDLVDFIKIMEGKEQEVLTQKGIERIRYSNLKGFLVYVAFNIKVKVNNYDEQYITKTVLYRLNNEFDVDIEIQDDNIDKKDYTGEKIKSNIHIELATKELNLETRFDKLKIPMIFPGKIKVNLQIHRIKPNNQLENKKQIEMKQRTKINF